MEPIESRMARVEEGLVSVKGDTMHMRKKLDILTESHWKLSGKVISLAGVLSIFTTVLTTIALRLIAK